MTVGGCRVKRGYLKGIDGASVRRNDVFIIGELEIGNPIGFDPTWKGIRTDFTHFSISDILPHFPSISSASTFFLISSLFLRFLSFFIFWPSLLGVSDFIWIRFYYYSKTLLKNIIKLTFIPFPFTQLIRGGAEQPTFFFWSLEWSFGLLGYWDL